MPESPLDTAPDSGAPRSAPAAPRLGWLLTFCTMFQPVAGIGLGFAALTVLRLERPLSELPLPLCLFFGTAGITAQRATGWLRRSCTTPAARLRFLGWLYGIHAATALLALGIRSEADVSPLAVVVGITLGATIPTGIRVIPALTPTGRRTMYGTASAAVLLATAVLWLVPARPESVLGITAALMGLSGWLAWSRQDAMADATT